MNSKDIINKYKLVKHPEGGWYKEVIRSGDLISFNGKKRSAVTSIYFLLTKGGISKWHIVDSDEIWIFLDGEPLELHQANLKTGKYFIEKIDPENRQSVVPSNTWQAAKSKGEFSFVACVVAPGFEFEGFKLLKKDSLEFEKLLKLNKSAKEFTYE
ncbi:MAG: cupin domain-containing protein [bacterium]|nr:cupin domain-containing protein [bacterium]